jgi:hypothetical protein
LSLLERGENKTSKQRVDDNIVEVHDLDEEEELNLAIQLSLGLNVN